MNSISESEYHTIVNCAICDFFKNHEYSNEIFKRILQYKAISKYRKFKSCNEERIFGDLHEYFSEFLKNSEETIVEIVISYFFQTHKFKSEILRKILAIKALEHLQKSNLSNCEEVFYDLYEYFCDLANSKKIDVNEDILFCQINDNRNNIYRYLKGKFPQMQHEDIEDTIQKTFFKYFEQYLAIQREISIKNIATLLAYFRTTAANFYITAERNKYAIKRGGQTCAKSEIGETPSVKNPRVCEKWKKVPYDEEANVHAENENNIHFRNEIQNILELHLPSNKFKIAIEIIDRRYYGEDTWKSIAEDTNRSIPTLRGIHNKILEILKKEIK